MLHTNEDSKGVVMPQGPPYRGQFGQWEAVAPASKVPPHPLGEALGLRRVQAAFPDQPLEGTAHFHLGAGRGRDNLVDRARHGPAHPGRADCCSCRLLTQ
jgi:hypothetical protein